jgi:uncharacterized protein (TIGR04255 family)
MVDWLTREPEDRHLKASPLALVVCQVRHERELAASDATRVLKVCEALDWASELTERVAQELNVIAGEAGMATTSLPATRGWQLQSADGQWIATVMPDQFSLETRAYPSWEEFRTRMLALTDAVLTYVGPALEQRIGLRFVNQLSHSSVVLPADWAGRISDVLLQRDLYDALGDSLRAAMQVLEIRTPDDLKLVIRHGCQPSSAEGGNIYVLDYDCSRQGIQALSRDQIADTIEKLHRLALQAFEMATTSSLRDELEKGTS